MNENKEDEISDKIQAFVDRYLIDLNATKTYQEVYGCSYEAATSSSARLLVRSDVQKEIQRRMDERAKRCGIEQDWVLMNLRETIDRCMQRTPVLDAEGKEIYIYQPMAAIRAMDLAGKHLGMYKEKHEHKHSGTVTHMHGGLPRTVEFLKQFRASRENGDIKKSMQN